MDRVRNKLAVLAAAIAMLWGVPAFGQGPAPPYRYPTPALSPWFNLYNKQGGPVDNYNMYVRPDMQLRNTLQTQQFDIQRQATGASTPGQQVSQLEADRQQVQPTGTPAGFMNHGRFFGTQQAGSGASGAHAPPAKAARAASSAPAPTSGRAGR